VVVQHNAWYGKHCPRKIRDNPTGWSDLLRHISQYMNLLQTPSSCPDFFAETGHSVGGAICEHFRANGGVVRYGFPLEQETARILEDGNDYTTQLFERAMLHWRPGEPVGEARIGFMYKQLADQ
jgi:hypothetical protein